MSKIFTYGGSYNSILEITDTLMTTIGIANNSTIYNTGTAFEKTGAQIWLAFNNLILGYQSIGIWGRRIALYPFLGASATACKWNALDIRNLDAAFRLDFQGGFSFDGGGPIPNGTDAHANTFIIPATHLFDEDSVVSFYSRTNVADGVLGVEVASISAGINYNVQAKSGNIGVAPNYRMRGILQTDDTFTNQAHATANDTRGSYDARIRSGNQLAIFKNGVLQDERTGAGLSLSTIPIYLFAANFYLGYAVAHSNKQLAMVSFWKSLTDTELANKYIVEQAFHTALNRAV
jgi:hypothetical protein